MKGSIFDLFFEKLGIILDWKEIDDLIISDNNIIRPMRGHAFEFMFDNIFFENFKKKLLPGIGDGNIDKMYEQSNGNIITFQIKTPVISSIKLDKSLSVNLHKTHGLEKRPQNLYPINFPCKICTHDGGAFPDFLIVQHPTNGLLIVPKDKIPENKIYPGHFADPVVFEWDSEWLNRWDLLGFHKYRGINLNRPPIEEQIKFPQLSKIINMTDEEIVTMFLQPENFRMINMNLKGNLREPALVSLLKQEVELLKPEGAYPKYDKITKNGFKIQIKGPSKGLSIKGKKIGVEVMGTHGKGAIRCYSKKDFDYLAIVIDPNYLDNDSGLDLSRYNFCFVSVEDLPLHYKNSEWKTTNKIYPICKFLIGRDEEGAYLIPTDNYRVPINFINRNKLYINKIPDEFKS